ncbi:zinc metallopeptidase [Persicirhabdus sediminis]|uniref:Zinc metallopeptidase n=1 Tax=Persicirhabdus sediminis TaxID=454144 RepID=A0A8J7MF53_9BACT|nr:zinc metallopeptidase [Persicirhabdus sediminis]
MIWIIVGISMLASLWVSHMLKSRFQQFSQSPISQSGREIAEMMLRQNGITDVKVISTPGQLTDHYNPANKTVNLSESVYQQRNVAAAAVAAHECGHAVQHAQAYHWLGMRSKLVPIVGLSSKMMNVILIMSIFGAYATGNLTLLWLYVACLSMVTLFSFITLPVEFDASKRALVWMQGTGVMSSQYQDQAKSALHWAAMTYVVAALASLAQLLYYLSILLGRRE